MDETTFSRAKREYGEYVTAVGCYLNKYKFLYQLNGYFEGLSAIELCHKADERKTSKNIVKRRRYIDPEEDTIYSANTQYGGNGIELKTGDEDCDKPCIKRRT